MASLYKHSNGIYYVKFTRDGKDTRISTHCRSMAKANLFFRSFDTKIKSSITLETLKRECIEASKFLGLKSQAQYRKTLTDFYEFTRNKLLSEVSKNNIQNFLKGLPSHYSPSTINMNLAVLKRCFEIAIENGWLQVNPCRKIKKIPVTSIVPEFTLEEANLVLNELQGEYYQIVKIAFNTGIRRNALCNLQWKDVDFKDEVIHLKNKINKKPQFVAFNQVVRDILLERSKLMDISGKVFNVNPEYLGKLVKKIILKLGLNPKLRFHSIRHTFGTEVVKKYGVHIAKEMLNHSNIDTTMKYFHLRKLELKEKAKGMVI